tara:strand:- start:8 stop:592 length:585 start_codon:yes stop_codon:yes gene_type:complete
MNQGLIILATITLVAGYLVYREIDTIKRKFGEIEKNSLEVEKIKRSIAIISGQSVYTPSNNVSNNSLVELNTQQNLIQKENKTDSDIESEYESSQVEEIKYDSDSDSDSVSDYNSEIEREKTIVKPNNEDENVYELVKKDETNEDENIEKNTKEDYIAEIKGMNVKFLKQALRDKNLPISGKRQELIDRLIQSL